MSEFKTYTDSNGQTFHEDELKNITECKCCFNLLYHFQKGDDEIQSIDRDLLILEIHDSDVKNKDTLNWYGYITHETFLCPENDFRTLIKVVYNWYIEGDLWQFLFGPVTIIVS